MNLKTSNVLGRVKKGQALYDSDLIQIAKKVHLHNLPSMKNIYSHDELLSDDVMQHLKKKAMMLPVGDPLVTIINTDDAGKEGEHWQVVWTCKGGRTELFDPYGMPPVQRGTTRLLDELAGGVNKLTHSSQAVQNLKDPTSNACGYHCLHYLWLREKIVPPHVSVDTLTDVFYKKRNFKKNDKKAINFVKHVFKFC